MNYVYVHDFSPVSALVIGAPGSEWILLPKRAAAFWEGLEKSSSWFQKICWEEPKKQKTRSCRAQELSRSSAQWRGREWERCTEQVQPARKAGRTKATTGGVVRQQHRGKIRGRSRQKQHRVRVDIGKSAAGCEITQRLGWAGGRRKKRAVPERRGPTESLCLVLLG